MQISRRLAGGAKEYSLYVDDAECVSNQRRDRCCMRDPFTAHRYGRALLDVTKTPRQLGELSRLHRPHTRVPAASSILPHPLLAHSSGLAQTSLDTPCAATVIRTHLNKSWAMQWPLRKLALQCTAIMYCHDMCVMCGRWCAGIEPFQDVVAVDKRPPVMTATSNDRPR